MKIRLIFWVLLSILFQGCGVYSFTGASISPEVKSVQVQYFPNQADLVQPTLSQVFTDALKDKFISQTSLDVINQSGDLVFEGAIKRYTTEPVAIQGNQQAALNRLTITVEVKFTNKINPEKSFESSFTQYSEYDSGATLSAVEEGLIQEITKALVEDVFNKAVVNW
ncbi:MAG TPA: LptE family protein [Bacteroidales bacterium]|nr:LptE family protein [Bacteroidales bacterium]